MGWVGLGLTRDLLSLSLWHAHYIHVFQIDILRNIRGKIQSCQDISASVKMWQTFNLLTYHWPKENTWDISTRGESTSTTDVLAKAWKEENCEQIIHFIRRNNGYSKVSGLGGEEENWKNPLLLYLGTATFRSKRYRVRMLQGPNVTGSKCYRAQTLQGSNVTGSKCYKVQMSQGLALRGDHKGLLPSLFSETDQNCTSWKEASSREIKSNRLGGGNTGERESDKGWCRCRMWNLPWPQSEKVRWRSPGSGTYRAEKHQACRKENNFKRPLLG